MASFEKINYALRPNKSIERKMMVEILRRVDAQFPLRPYRYIGMGSLWFVDFLLIHKAFGIRDMISIEKERNGRAEYNRPLKCVTVEVGDTTLVLPNLNLRGQRVIVWLDHDKNLQGPAIEDLTLVVERVPSGSIVAVTVNAHHGQLKGRKSRQGVELTPAEALNLDAGDLVPQSLDSDAVNRRGFPKTVSRILKRAFLHALSRSGRNEKFVPLFDFSYDDGTPMVTVGGMITNDKDKERLDSVDFGALDFLACSEGEPFEIRAPLLTLKEKAALDRCLPEEELNIEVIERRYGFVLKSHEVESYQRCYRYYPIFSELLM